MSDRYADFDAAFAERDKSAAPITVKLFGRQWELPAEMPAAAPLKVARFMAEGRDLERDLNLGELLDLAADLIPGETLRQWLDKGLTTERLGSIILWVIERYVEAENGRGVPEGEAQAPTGAAPGPSSNGGEPSKPTSGASTGSTSLKI